MIIKNISGEIRALHIHEFQINEEYVIPTIEIYSWSSNDDVLNALADESFQMHNDNGAIVGLSDQIDYLKGNSPKDVIINNEPRIEYTSKYTLQGKRVIGYIDAHESEIIDLKIENYNFPYGAESYSYKYLWGAMFKATGGSDDDYATFQIVDKDNILGYGAGFVVKEYIPDWSIFQDEPMFFKVECPGRVPVGFYLRCIYYNNAASGTAKFRINYEIHLKD